MKTMSDYNVFCTPEQTKKALELGAPIETYSGGDVEYVGINDCKRIIPTTEQMIGWLEEQRCIIEISIWNGYHNGTLYWHYDLCGYNHTFIFNDDINEFESRKEATLAAIDAALDYLISRKK